MSLGAACMSTFSGPSVNQPAWGDAYAEKGVGGLLVACTSPAGGFGQFVVVILALSIIGNNVPNLYSFALTAQVLGPWFQAIPRVVYAVLATGLAILIGILGLEHFEEALDTLLVLLAYWLAICKSVSGCQLTHADCTILILEHFVFRRGKWANYDIGAYDKYHLLPRGFAAAFAVCCGIAGAVIGMASVWHVTCST